MVYVEPEVVNPPKEQSVPQFNKKEIIAIIKEAQEAGLLPSNGFEEVEIKIYLSDLDPAILEGGDITIINEEKLNILKQIIQKALEGKVIYALYETPKYYGDGQFNDIITGVVSVLYTDSTVMSFGPVLEVNNTRSNAFNLSDALVFLYASYPTDLITLLATDPTKYLTLKFRVEK